MRAHLVAIPPSFSGLLTLMLGAVLSLSACGQPAQPGVGWSFSEDLGALDPNDGASDMGSDADAVDMEEEIDLRPAQSPPRVKMLRYRRQFEDCTSTTCMIELQIGISGANVARLQLGVVTAVEPLTPEDYDAINKIIEREGFIEQVRGDGWACPPQEDNPYKVTLRAEVRESGVMDSHIFDLSDCYKSEAQEPADELVELAEALFVRYFSRR